jgi:serine/threonine-protein kinase
MLGHIIVSLPIISLIVYLSLVHSSDGVFHINQQTFIAQALATKFPSNIIIDNITNAAMITKNPKETSFSIYENPTYGIKILYPAGWNKLEFGQITADGLVVGFALPREGKPLSEINVSDFILENVMIGVKTIPPSSYSFPKNVALEKFVNEQISSYKQSFADFHIITSNTTSIDNNHPAYQIQYTHKDGRATFDTLQIWTISGNTIYTILFNADPADYPIYSPIIRKVTDSFVIFNNNNNNQIKFKNV